MPARSANLAESRGPLPAEEPHAAALRAFRETGPWPLPELVPWSIDEAEHAELLALSRIESPEELAPKLLEESLPLNEAWQRRPCAPAEAFVLALREYCRAQLTILCCDDDLDLSANAACKLLRYEDRLRDAQMRHRPKLPEAPRPRAHPASTPHLLRRARGWFARAQGARSPHEIFRSLAREGDLFERLSSRAPCRARVLRLPAAWALTRAFHELSHTPEGKQRMRLACTLYRILIPGTRFFRSLTVELTKSAPGESGTYNLGVPPWSAAASARAIHGRLPRAPPR